MSETIHGHAVGNRNFSIDFLRFFAATIVVLYHYTIASPELHYGLDGLAFQYPVLESYLRYGYLGNDLFFIISGLVIFNSTKSATFTGFWYGRFSRLYPTYWICLGLTSILLLLVGTWSERGISFSIFLFNLTMLQKMVGVQDIDQVYWTLAYEMVFYFWVSLAILFGRRDYIISILCLLTLIALSAYFWPLNSLIHKAFLLDKIACFFAGAVIAEVHAKGMSRSRFLQLALALTTALLYGKTLAIAHIRDYQSLIDIGVVYAIIIFIFAIVLCTGWFSVPRRLRTICIRLGAITYPLYLIHNVMGSIFSRQISDFVFGYWNLAVTVLFAYFVAWLLSRHVEEPAMVFLRRLWRPARA